MKEIRHQKISEGIRERVASILEFKIQDPRRDKITLTVTRVKLAKDYSRCVVFYSVLGGEKEKSLAKHMLSHARGFVRSELAKSLETRRVPEIVFEFDETIGKAVDLSKRISEILEGKKP